MRVARVLAVLEPGGAQLGALRLTQGLARRGVQSRVLAGEASATGLALFSAAGVPVEVYGAETGLQYTCSDGFAEWLAPRLRGADLVHGHMFGGWWAAGRAAPDGVPLAGSEHNAMRWPGRPLTSAYVAGLRRLDRFYTHGPAVAELVRSLDPAGDRVRAGTSAIEDPRGAQPKPSLRGRRVVFAGRLHAEKGPDLLVEALARMDDAPLAVFVGAGPAEEELPALVRARGLQGRVSFPGWQPQVAPWLVGAAACVVPSRHEAWSQTAVLALALGVPVIGTRVEGLPGTLGNGRGILVAPDDPDALAATIARVLAGHHPHPAAGRAYAARFTPQAVAARYLADYASLLTAVPAALAA